MIVFYIISDIFIKKTIVLKLVSLLIFSVILIPSFQLCHLTNILCITIKLIYFILVRPWVIQSGWRWRRRPFTWEDELLAECALLLDNVFFLEDNVIDKLI